MFDLERAEKGILIFLSASLLVGLSLSAYMRSRGAAPVAVRAFSLGRDAVGARAEERRPAPRATININTADGTELARLTGVGKALAERIVAYRASHGLFLSTEDIKKVRGIGPALYEKIKADICVQ